MPIILVSFSVIGFIIAILVTKVYFGNKGYRFVLPFAHTVVLLVGYTLLSGFFGGDSMNIIVLSLLTAALDFPFALTLYPSASHGSGVALALTSLFAGGLFYALIGWLIDSIRAKQFIKLSRRGGVVLLAVVLAGSFWIYQRVSYSNMSDYQKALYKLDHAKTDKEKFDDMWEVMVEAYNAKKFQAAKEYADKIIADISLYTKDFCAYSTLYDAYTILGLLTLKDNKVQNALGLLKKSVDFNLTTDQKKCFTGLNMSLADALYQKGYKKEVLAFIEKCDSLQYKEFEYYKEIKGYLDRLKEGKAPQFDINISLYLY